MTTLKQSITTGNTKYSHGDILQVKIGKANSIYAYCKYIDLRKANLRSHAYQLLLVYNHIFTEPDMFDNISTRDLLCNPLRFYGSNILPDNWKRIGKEVVYDHEFYLMDLKSHWPKAFNTKEDIMKLDWYCTSVLNPNSSKKCQYDEVRHLESSTVNFIDKLPFRIYLEYLKQQQISIQYDNSIYREVYVNSFDIPVLKDLPDKVRFQFCEGGITSIIGTLPKYSDVIIFYDN